MVFGDSTKNTTKPLKVSGWIWKSDHLRRNWACFTINIFYKPFLVEGLGIIGLSDAMPEKITQLSHYAPFVSAQAGQEIWIFYNNKVEWKYKAENEITSHFLLSYGFQYF